MRGGLGACDETSCEPDASGFPYATLADMAADSVSTSTETSVTEGTPLFLYQSIENKLVAEMV